MREKQWTEKPAFNFTDGHETWTERGSHEGSARRRLAENLCSEWGMAETEKNIKAVEATLTLA